MQTLLLGPTPLSPPLLFTRHMQFKLHSAIQTHRQTSEKGYSHSHNPSARVTHRVPNSGKPHHVLLKNDTTLRESCPSNQPKRKRREEAEVLKGELGEKCRRQSVSLPRTATLTRGPPLVLLWPSGSPPPLWSWVRSPPPRTALRQLPPTPSPRPPSWWHIEKYRRTDIARTHACPGVELRALRCECVVVYVVARFFFFSRMDWQTVYICASLRLSARLFSPSRTHFRAVNNFAFVRIWVRYWCSRLLRHACIV